MIGSALLLVAAIGATASKPPTPVPWSEARAALAELICSRARTLPDGREASSVVAGRREFCELPAAATPLQRSVDMAYERSRRLISSIQPDGLSMAYEQGISTDERTRRARNAYLAS